MKDVLKVLFYVVVAILAVNISGCATAYYGVPEREAFSASDEKYQKWESLIEVGPSFGVDFTDPFFSTLDSPSNTHRFCYSDILENIKKVKDASSSLILCSVQERFTLAEYAFTKQKNTPTDYMNESSAALIKGLPYFGITGESSVAKVKEKNGIFYYLIKVGKSYFSYRGIFFVENEKTKQLGAKLVVLVADKSSKAGSLDIVIKKAELLRSKLKVIE